MTYQNLVLNSKRKSSITAPAPLTTKLILKQARLTLRRAFLFFLKYGLNFVSRLNVFCFNLPILQWSFAKRFDKKLGNSPGVCQYPAPGQRKICKCPTPGTEKAGKCFAVAQGGLGAVGDDWCIIISKRLKFPWDDRTDTNFIAPLGMNF